MNCRSFKLILLVALKQEIPESFQGKIPILSIKSLLANNLHSIKHASCQTVLCIQTGVGATHIKQIFKWIQANCSAQWIINFGTAGSSIYPKNTFVSAQLVRYHTKKISISHSHFPLQCDDYIQPVELIDCVDQLTPSVVDCCDMESYFIVEESNQAKLPVTIIKCVSDQNNLSADIDFSLNIAHCRKQFERLFTSLTSPSSLSISVIIPTYNRNLYLKRAIDSVLNQTVQSECIVIDDSSTDGTADLLNQYKDSIKSNRLIKNMGVSCARNKGVSLATGNWVAFLDSDDEWRPNKLANQIEHLNHHPFYRLSQCDEKWVRNGKQINKKKYHQKSEGNCFDTSLERCMISPSCVLINKDLFTKFGGFDESLRACEDYDLWLQLTRHYPVGYNTDIDVIKYAGHAHQLSDQTCLDQFRLKSLHRCLSNEKTSYYKRKILNIYQHKSSILINGRKKRY